MAQILTMARGIIKKGSLRIELSEDYEHGVPVIGLGEREEPFILNIGVDQSTTMKERVVVGINKRHYTRAHQLE